MNNQRKLTQVSDQLLSQIQVPVILGNEFFVVTQQDSRRVEDTRLLTYNKLYNGELVPLDFEAVECLIALLNRTLQKTPPAPASVSTFFDGSTCTTSPIHLNQIMGKDNAANSLAIGTEPMDVSSVATTNTPLTICKTTSTTSLNSIDNSVSWPLARTKSRCVYFRDEQQDTGKNKDMDRNKDGKTCKCGCQRTTALNNRKECISIGTNTKQSTVDHVTQTVSSKGVGCQFDS